MPTTRRRRRRPRKPSLSPTARAFLWDQPLPVDYDCHELRQLRYHADFYLKPLWAEYREQVLTDWLIEQPGARPQSWWQYDAPRQRAVMQGRELPCEVAVPRKRLGGIGTPAFDTLAFKPYYRYGIPAIWLWKSIAKSLRKSGDCRFSCDPIDWDDPPLFESEAQHLMCHGLLLEREEQRLTEDNFIPELLSRRHFLYGSPAQ
jgi:hypothetical protein